MGLHGRDSESQNLGSRSNKTKQGGASLDGLCMGLHGRDSERQNLGSRSEKQDRGGCIGRRAVHGAAWEGQREPEFREPQ